MSIQSFGPSTGFARFSTLAFPTVIPIANSVAAAVTYTPAELLSGYVLRDTASHARADLLPAASAIIAAINGCQAGTAFRTWIGNTSAGAGAITLTTNTGLTLNGNLVIAAGQQAELLVICADVRPGYEAVTVYSLVTTPAAASNVVVASTGFAGPVTGYAADTYLAGSAIAIPVTRLVAGQSQVSWRFGVSKTGAGTAAPTMILRYGTAGAVADAAVVTFTFGAQTAAVDRGVVEVIARFSVIGALAILDAEALLTHQLATTGLNVTTTGKEELAVSSSAFDSTVAASILGLSINGGTSAAWTITSVAGVAVI